MLGYDELNTRLEGFGAERLLLGVQRIDLLFQYSDERRVKYAAAHATCVFKGCKKW